MRTANEVKSGVLDHFQVAVSSAIRHRIAPAGVVLMHIRALEIIMLAVQEKPLVRRELEPAETERRREIIHGVAGVQHRRFNRVKIRMIGMPELRADDCLARLVENQSRVRRDGLGGFHFCHLLSICVKDAGCHRDGFGLAGVVHDFRLHVNRGGGLRHLRRGDECAIPRHMQRCGDN